MIKKLLDKPYRLPIKLILPEQGKEKRVPAGGGPAIPFRNVDSEFRNSLNRQVLAVKSAVLPHLNRVGVAPMRVKILKKACAKSHRPEQLFSESTCPIIGAGALGELFVQASEVGLVRLSECITEGKSQKMEKEVSSVEAIEPITPFYRLKGLKLDEILKKCPKRHEKFVAKVKLFKFDDLGNQKKVISEFLRLCNERNLEVLNKGYSDKSYTFGIGCRTTEDLDALSRFVGVRSIASMPLIKSVRPKAKIGLPNKKLYTRDEVEGDVPVIVVVDSGVSSKIPELESWVVGRDVKVAPQYRNHDHGTFVAGLICWGNELNPDIENIDTNPCAIYDLQVVPNDDPSKGEIDYLTEQELLTALEMALEDHANEYKVWNLSLGTDEVCSLDDFSELAVELDDLQEKYKVSFVVSAGNFSQVPLMDFPRENLSLEKGRITTPADSVLAITVGSLSHINHKPIGPDINHPSAFSRHGAGPNYIVKPDLVHYGGACATDATKISGIKSICESGIIENIGTSFSTPLVSKTLAQIYHQINPTPSPVLARALLTHHARDPRTDHRIPDGDENFFGFGVPKPLPYCLECTPYSSTLVFEDILRPGFFLEWEDFPYPDSLRKDGKFFGEIWMTVAFSPSRGARWGSEYCETHIDAHFGVYKKTTSRKTGKTSLKFKGLVPPEHKNPNILHETYQVEKLRKWAPVRTYYGNLGKNGEKGEQWRLMVRLLTRHGIEQQESYRPQPFALIVTIADPAKKAPVYDEMARIVLNRFAANNLAVRATARIRKAVS